ncbi:MAG TPA: hypothetical protein VLB04_11060 [Methanotrichaceae archaeon]|nr:hypothetical protein [Methanotrichaceae archaeon]
MPFAINWQTFQERPSTRRMPTLRRSGRWQRRLGNVEPAAVR